MLALLNRLGLLRHQSQPWELATELNIETPVRKIASK